MRSIAGWIERHQEFSPQSVAIRSNDNAETYAAFAERIRASLNWLHLTGAQSGSRIAWLGPNSVEMLAMLFACAEARCILLPLNWRLSAAELLNILADADASMLIVDEAFAERTDALRPFSGAIKSTSAITGDPATAGALGGEVSEDTPLLMVYTSGTTGTPKGAVLSQQAIEFNALNAVHMHDMCSRDTILTVLPTFHVGGLNIQTTPALYSGAEVILEAQFDPGRWLQLVATRKPTLSVLVPATMHAVMQHPDWSTTSLDSLRSISTGSTDVPPDLIEAFHTRNIPVIQIYGATETGPVAIYQRVNEAKTHVGSIGYPGLHTNVKLVDRDGSEILDQQPGEIWVQGKHVATGYWDVSVGKADAFDQGWFPSGDVARRDEDGRYWFVDRIKRIIISGGENIYPIELERILDASDLIEEASVVGKSHERWGAVPIVVAVARNPGVAEADVLALFDQHVARFKRPHGVLFVDALPRNALGKIEYGELSDWVAGA